MTATLPTQEPIDRIAAELAPDIVHIRMKVTRDTADEPAIYFRVILSDEACSRRDRLHAAATRIRYTVGAFLEPMELEHSPYFRFRSVSEQAQLREPQWD